MPAIAYPIAANAHEVLKAYATLAQAERAREAETLSQSRTGFVSETLEAAFVTREAAEAYYQQTCPGLLEQPFARLQCHIKSAPTPSKRRKGAEPVRQSQWQLSLSYWKPLNGAVESPPPVASPKVQARAIRKRALGEAMTAAELKALAHAPLDAYLPQKALDIGLFEIRAPENPSVIIPDE